MDPRVREHAEILIEHSVSLESGDNVVIVGPPVAEDLIVALHESVGDHGANPLAVFQSGRAKRAYLRASDTIETPTHVKSLIDETDVYIAIRGDENVTETSDVTPETNADYVRAIQPIRQERLTKRWVVTQYPAPANAQLAEMSTEAYEGFVWDAITKDWDAQREHQAQLLERLDAGETVRIVSGETTDLTMSIEGMTVINDYGENNLPGGEVFTAPVPDTVEGEVLFDKPLYHQGREVEDAYLRLVDGEVVEHDAAKNLATLTEVLETDDGARRFGELGIGMNRDIDQFTYNMLFDEKMGDTVHLALGFAYDDCVPADHEQNDSAVHVDMIVDMSEDSFIDVDGEAVQRNGHFVFEEDFE